MRDHLCMALVVRRSLRLSRRPVGPTHCATHLATPPYNWEFNNSPKKSVKFYLCLGCITVSDVGGGWRFNHWYGKIWKEEGGWRWVQDGPCWKYHVKHTGKRKREEPPLPMGESLLEARMTAAVGISEPPHPQPAAKRQRVPLLT